MFTSLYLQTNVTKGEQRKTESSKKERRPVGDVTKKSVTCDRETHWLHVVAPCLLHCRNQRSLEILLSRVISL